MVERTDGLFFFAGQKSYDGVGAIEMEHILALESEETQSEGFRAATEFRA